MVSCTCIIVSESVTSSQNLLDFFLDTIDFADETSDSLIDIVVGLDDLLKDLQVHLCWSRCVVVVSLDELLLGRESSELLLHVPVTLLFLLFDLASLSVLLL